MASPTKVNLKIYQGSTFKEVFRWESSTKTYAVISAITKTAPAVVTATSHGMPAGWRFKVSNVGGMKEINSDEYYTASSVGANDITINSLNSTGFTAYTTGGVIEYNTPVNLVGVTARMQIREKLTSTTFIDELTTENGKIIINNTDKTITLLLTDLITSAYTFSTAVYSIELVVNGETIPFVYGNISLEKEITR